MVVLLDAVLSLEGRDLLGMGQAVVYVEDEHATLVCNPGFQLLKAIADVGRNARATADCRSRTAPAGPSR
jgi:hypothetical protein